MHKRRMAQKRGPLRRGGGGGGGGRLRMSPEWILQAVLCCLFAMCANIGIFLFHL